jgi:hypothetical protein
MVVGESLQGTSVESSTVTCVGVRQAAAGADRATTANPSSHHRVVIFSTP